MQEEQNNDWKSIIGFEGHYYINSSGKVMSIKKGKKRILKPWLNKGYEYVCLHKPGVIQKQQVHRIVGKHFIPNPENKPHINHKDGNPRNNHVFNLEWCTDSENLKHSYDFLNRQKSRAKGSRNTFAKLNELQVRIIKHLKGEFTTKQTAKLFGVNSGTTIGNIWRGDYWKHLQ